MVGLFTVFLLMSSSLCKAPSGFVKGFMPRLSDIVSQLAYILGWDQGCVGLSEVPPMEPSSCGASRQAKSNNLWSCVSKDHCCIGVQKSIIKSKIIRHLRIQVLIEVCFLYAEAFDARPGTDAVADGVGTRSYRFNKIRRWALSNKNILSRFKCRSLAIQLWRG